MSLRSRYSLLALAGASVAFSLNACKSRGFNTHSGTRQVVEASELPALPAQLLPGVPNPEYIIQGVFSYSNTGMILVTDERNQVTSKVRIQGNKIFSSKEDPSKSLEGKDVPGEWNGQTFMGTAPAKCNDVSMIFAGKKIVGNDVLFCQFAIHSTATVFVNQASTDQSEPSAEVLQSFFDADDNIGKPAPRGKYWGFSIIIIPLGADGKGYKQAYYDGFLEKAGQSKGVSDLRAGLAAKAAPRAAKDGTIAKVEGGKAVASPNTKVDHEAVLKAFKDVQREFKVEEKYRNSCLMNFRAKSWTDLAAHYYCQLPYDSVRTCYSGQLILGGEDLELRLRATDPIYKELADKSESKDATEEDRAKPNIYKIPELPALYQKAWNACFEPASKEGIEALMKNEGLSKADAEKRFERTPEQQWIAKNQAAVFKHIMWTVPGTWDFNIESEQKIINDFYGSGNRPRRALDTWEKWEAVQPRYDKVRNFQFKNMIAAAPK